MRPIDGVNTTRVLEATGIVQRTPLAAEGRTRPSGPLPTGRAMTGRLEVYLDNNATTRVLPEVMEAVAQAMRDGCGNPSSVHAAGARSRKRLWLAREQVAALVSTDPAAVVFTGGATEANNLALQSLLGGPMDGCRLVTTAVERSSALAVADALARLDREVMALPVDSKGLVCEEEMARAIAPERTLVSVQWANNETGVVQPIAQLATRARALGARFHTDAVQAVGKIPVDLNAVPVDFLSLSGHKLHGPLGAGALVARDRATQVDTARAGVGRGLAGAGSRLVAAVDVRGRSRGGVAPGHRERPGDRRPRRCLGASGGRLQVGSGRHPRHAGRLRSRSRQARARASGERFGRSSLAQHLQHPFSGHGRRGARRPARSRGASGVPRVRPAPTSAPSRPTCSAPWASPSAKRSQRTTG